MSENADREVLSWASFPAAENKRKAVLVACFLVVFFVFMRISFGTIWFIISLLLLGPSVAPYFGVTRYRMTESGVEAYHLLYTVRKSWASFRSYYVDRRGVLLSPFDRPSRLENYRGLYVRFGAKKEEVMRFVRMKVGEEKVCITDPRGGQHGGEARV